MEKKIILELSHVDIFQKKEMVLRDVNLEIKEGEFVYIVGKTGSGKSSFLKLLYGDLPMKNGEGRIGQFNLKGIKDESIPYLRRSLGIVFQDFKLLPDRTVFKNLEFVLKATGWTSENYIKVRINEVLSKVGVEDKQKSYPNQLSGGEQQRVAIARALLNNPPIILADEPTGNLDPSTSLGIMEMLKEINDSGRTIIMASHDYGLIRKFKSRTFMFKDGSVEEVDIKG